jgi:hypothetical protein
MKKILSLILLVTFGMCGIANAQKPAPVLSDKTGWHKIAETTVDFKKERDEVSVLISDKFAFLKFKVLDASINLSKMEVYFENGEKQDISVNMPLKPEGESRIIELNGGERSIKKIAFEYKTISNNKDEKAKVQIWGSKTNSDKM